MNIDVQEQKFCQSLDQLIHSTTQLTNTLVSNVVESSPQLYMKTKFHLLSCIDSLSQDVVKLQQAWNELTFYRKKAGLASADEESVVFIPKENKKSTVARELLTQSVPPPNTGGSESYGRTSIYSSRDDYSFGRTDPQILHKENTV